MKLTKLFSVISLVVFLIVSCEEVIKIDLNSSAPKVVIEAVVTDKPGPYEVKITKTVDFYNPSIFPQISGASVVISDEDGNQETLTESEPGLYKTGTLQGVPGKKYTLEINIDGNQYTAQSTIMEPIKIDSMAFKLEDKVVFGGGGGPKSNFYSLHVYFKDRPGTKDYCVLKVFKNDTILDKNFLYNGKFTDGNEVDFNRFGTRFDKGDVVRVELITMGAENFDYVSTLGNVIANGAKGPGGFTKTGTPANPNTNLNNNALGFFGAYSIDKDSIVIK